MLFFGGLLVDLQKGRMECFRTQMHSLRIMVDAVKEFLTSNISGPMSGQIITLVQLCGILLVAVAAYYLTKKILMVLEKAILRSPTEWDDDLLNPRFMRAVSQLSPAITVAWLLPKFFSDTPGEVRWIDILTSLYILWAGVRIVTIFIDNLYDAFISREQLRPYAIKGIFQMFKLVVISVGAIIALSILINKTPVAILTALGASAAVLMLVFKDTILGLVASVQLTANKMLDRGDWISMPNRDLNGEVLDVSLTTVKVRNWDNSVTTLPPYSLVSESFRNYRPMQESGGRRVDRSVYIDVNTVGFLSSEEIETLRSEGFLNGIESKNNSRVVNLGLWRDYIEDYLRKRSDINSEMTLMVRQMQPTNAGLPVQLYFFTRTTAWVEYEHIQADVFDHVYATVRRFGLAIYQSPAGTDLCRIGTYSRI